MAERLSVIFNHDNILLTADGQIPRTTPELINYCEFFSSEECVAFLADDTVAPERFSWVNARYAWQFLSDKEWAIVAKTLELANWNRTERFCRKCGSGLSVSTQISKRCPVCGEEWFAPMSPAVMVIIEDDNGRILLAHNAAFRKNFYGLIAGFVETGETLEQCVEREVKEETGLLLRDIRYVASQSWPFPHQLMIGFHARKAGGELKFADGELTDGGFYDPDSLPEIPTMPSLARILIDRWRSSRCRQ